MENSRVRLPKWIIPIAIGTASFFMIFDARILDVSNITWLHRFETSTYYLGWQFYRNSPWTFPIGLNPNYGLELSNSIVYSDSIPLLAMFFKLISRMLPESFQYFGPWLLACLILQATFAWKIFSLFSRNTTILALSSAFFAFAPPFLCRTVTHFGLAAHFLILAALYLNLRGQKPGDPVRWALLVAVAPLIHGYIFAMVFLLWVADLLKRAMNENGSTTAILVEFYVGMLFQFLVLWQAGFFSVGSSLGEGGFGNMRMHILSLFDPSFTSYVLRPFSSSRDEFEGFNYLGLGGIFALVFAIALCWKQKAIPIQLARKHFPLLGVLLLLTLFALSNRIGIGQYNLTIDLPSWILDLVGPFRASGRMFWPAFYSIQILTILIIIRQMRAISAIVVIGVSLLLQIADGSAGWLKIREMQDTSSSPPGSQWPSPFKDKFWDKAPEKYRVIKQLMPNSLNTTNWELAIAYYALRHKMATDIVYLVRSDKAKLMRARENAGKMIEGGSFERDTLYILDRNVFSELSKKKTLGKNKLKIIDGYYVLEPDARREPLNP